MTISGLDEYVARQLAAAPPLTEEQRERLGGIFAPTFGKSVPPPSKPVKPKRPKPTTIYRQYDKCGCLLYVGIAYDAVSRNYSHRGGSWWAKWIDHIDLAEQAYDDRAQALDAEREFIRTESPVFNTVHALDRNRATIHYLIEHGHWGHLSVNAVVSASEKPDLLRTLDQAGLLADVTWHKDPIEHAVDWSDPLLRSFTAKTEENERGCWRWQGHITKAGYPQFPHPQTRSATRAAWLIFRGPIPNGHVVRPFCGVGDCVNHRHLTTKPGSFRSVDQRLAACDRKHPGVSPRWGKRANGTTYCRECNRLRSARE